jgi:hypothetical protein
MDTEFQVFPDEKNSGDNSGDSCNKMWTYLTPLTCVPS